MTETDLAWLAGFWDGEGSISLYRSAWKWKEGPGVRRLKNHQREPERYRAYMAVTNTHAPSMERIHVMLDAMGVKHYFYRKEAYAGHLGKLPMMQILVMSHVGSRKLLQYVRPYLFTKRAQGDALARWCEIAPTRDPHLRYTDEQRELAIFLRQRARHGNPQPIPTGLVVHNDEVVGPVQRLAGETPNDTPASAPRTEQLSLFRW